MKKNVYLDNAATTQMYPEVIDKMVEVLNDEYGNPSANYKMGEQASQLISEARENIAKTLGCKPNEIYFTSGGTESDNWAIKGIAEAYSYKGKHIITSTIEHKAVLKTCRWLGSRGYEVTYIEPDERGVIHPESVRNAIRDDTILVSIMTANNEIGTTQPIKEIAQICNTKGVFFHTDAVQAYGHIKMNVYDLGVAMLSASGHKFGGPKGVGFLVVREGIHLPSYIHGGGQENGKRAGTENVPGIVGMGVAAKIAHENLTIHGSNLYVQGMRDHFIESVINNISDVKLNGSLLTRLPNNVNFTFKGVAANSAVQLLGEMGVYCSAGSACNNGDPAPSHVLTAIGLSKDEAQSTLRFTLSEKTTIEDIDYAVEMIKTIVEMLR